MAELYPFSNHVLQLLQTGPTEGTTHRWLARVAGGLSHLLHPEHCYTFLRQACDKVVTHRLVPDQEIEDAVDYAYGGSSGPVSDRKAFDWPVADQDLISEVISRTEAAFDVSRECGVTAKEVLPNLFKPGELVCFGPTEHSALILPLESMLQEAHLHPFIVVNPMRGFHATNSRGRPSARCQNNVATRRHLVAEFDDRRRSKAEQAHLIQWLRQSAPLVLAVDSGGKSLHAWFRVDHLRPRDQGRFFALACLVGADESRWDCSGYLRMPGGTRKVDGVSSTPQRILYFAPNV